MVAKSGRQRAFTLVELLVVVAVITLLVAILLPALAGAKRNSRKTATLACLHGIGEGMAAYQAEWANALPTNLDTAHADNRTFEGLAVLAAAQNIPAKFFINPNTTDTPASALTSEGWLVFVDQAGTPVTTTSPADGMLDMAKINFHCSFSYDHEPKVGQDAERLHIYVGDRADYANGRAFSGCWEGEGGCYLWSDQHAEFLKTASVLEQNDPNVYHHNQYFSDTGVPGAGEGASDVNNGIFVSPSTIDTHLRFFAEDEDNGFLPHN